MNKKETAMILAVLQAAYPQFYAKQTGDDIMRTVGLWAEMFADEPYELVATATKALIKTRVSTFPPGVGELSEKIQQLTRPEEMTEMEAWALVYRATCNSAYNSEREFEKLPETVRRVVGSPRQLFEWSQMDGDTVNSVIASNFQRSYRARTKNQREYEALPASVRALVSSLTEGGGLKQLEE